MILAISPLCAAQGLTDTAQPSALNGPEMDFIDEDAIDDTHSKHTRARKYELFLLGQMFEGGDATLPNGTNIEFEEAIQGGFGLGYNASPHFNYNVEMIFGTTDTVYRTGGVPFLRDESVMFFLNANVELYLLEGPVTPLITAGLGFFNATLEQKIGGAKITETDFSYGYGAGVRWDINDKIFLKGVYRFTITELEGFEEEHEFESINIYLGIKF